MATGMVNERHSHEDNEEGDLLTERCTLHTDKFIEFFCVDHDALLCSNCMYEHRRCDGVEKVTDSIEDLNKDQKVHRVPEQLKTTLQNLDQIISALEQHTEEQSQCEHTLLEEIEEYTTRLLAKIVVLKQNARQEVSAKHGQAAKEATKKTNECTTAKRDIETCLDDMTSAENRKAHLFILKKKGQSMTKKVEALYEESEDMIKKARCIFKPDLRIEDTLNELSSLVTQREKYKVLLQRIIDTTVKEDSRSCCIMGCCLLPDGSMLLGDYRNCRVKHMDISHGTIKDHLDANGRPWGIAGIGAQKVAVVSGKKMIHAVSLGNKMMFTSTIQLQNKCYRFAQSNGELFTSNLSNCMYVYDNTGTLLRTIRKDESGHDMFSYITSIVLNKSGDRVYVTDWYKGLICTDRAGHEVFRLSGKELGLSAAYDVCTDEQKGIVLVCGYKSSNVVQITEDGLVIGEILSKNDRIVKPQCMCYDAVKRRLFVGGYTSNLLEYQLA